MHKTWLTAVLVAASITACKGAPASPPSGTPHPAEGTQDARASLAKNAENLKTVEQAVHWTDAEVWRHRLLAEGADWYMQHPSFCPGLDAIQKRRVNDEFEEKAREREATALKQKCFERIKTGAPLSPLMVMDIRTDSVRYDFERSIYTLSLNGTYVHGDLLTKYIRDDTEWDSIFTHDGSTFDDHSTTVVFTGLPPGFVTRPAEDSTTKDALLSLPLGEQEAQMLKKRLDKGITIQVAAIPKGYGPGELVKKQTGEAIKTMNVQAVGYRIVDVQGELLAWTPFGATPDGKPASVPSLNFRTVTAAATAPRPGTINLYSTPSAAVFVDGADIGQTTPLLSYELPAGVHSIRLVADSGEEQVKLTVKPGQALTKTVLIGSGRR